MAATHLKQTELQYDLSRTSAPQEPAPAGPQPRSSEIKLEALIVFFELSLNRLLDSNSLEDIAVYI